MKTNMSKDKCNSNSIRCYPQGECPLKDKCLWRGVQHLYETCSDVEKFDAAKPKEKVNA